MHVVCIIMLYIKLLCILVCFVHVHLIIFLFPELAENEIYSLTKTVILSTKAFVMSVVLGVHKHCATTTSRHLRAPGCTYESPYYALDLYYTVTLFPVHGVNS